MKGVIAPMMILLVLTPVVRVTATDLGAIGRTYHIQETDFLKWLKQHMQHLKEQGRLEQYQQRFQRQVKAGIQRPEPVDGLKRTAQARTWTVDPSVTLTRDLYDANGRLIHKQGEQVNPLWYSGLSKRLLFFNADDPEQVAWIADHRRHAGEDGQQQADKLILVKGNVPDQVKHWQTAVYFDQGGDMVQRFGIQQVPAIIEQEGDHLRGREVRP